MNDSQDILEFSTVVEMFDVTPRTLRYYEYLELISPIREGRKRFYTRRELGRIKAILQGRRFGFKLEEIRQWLEMYDPRSGNRAQLEAWLKRGEPHIEDLKTRRAELDEVIGELEEYKSYARNELEKLRTRN